MDTVEELKQDCEELQKLLKLATRCNVRQLIASEITTLESRIPKLEEEQRPSDKQESKSNEKSEGVHLYTQKIQSYGWDQTSKSVKIYISLSGVESIPEENIKLNTKSDSFELFVMNLNKKNHHLNVKKLLEPVDPSTSSVKAKAGNVIITLKKKEAGNWSHLTKSEKAASEIKTPKLDKDDADPSSSIMKMMKQMYDDGDDEMKRTIAKAWTESREKQASGGLPGF